MSKIRKTYLLDEGLIEVIKKIKSDNHYNSETSVIIEAVNTLNRKLNPGYVNQRLATAGKTPEQRAENQMKIQEIKKDREEKTLLSIAEKLGAKIIKLDGGEMRVQYFIYDKNNRYMQEVPLEMMSDELVDNQYHPSMEDIVRRQKEKTVNYDPQKWE